MDNIYRQLIESALEVRKNAYAPTSKFYVGAALLCENNEIYTGCNVENAALTPNNCAERTAIFSAVAQGIRNFKAIAVVGGRGISESPHDYCYPCGVCRQTFAEFCSEDFIIIVAKSPEDYRIHTLGELLPYSFGPKNL